MKERHHHHVSKHKSSSFPSEKTHSHSKDHHHKHHHHHHHRRDRSESVEEERKCKKRKHKTKEEAEDVERPSKHKSHQPDRSNGEEISNNKYKNSVGANSVPKSRWETEEEDVPERQKPVIKKMFIPKRQSSAERGAPKWGKQSDNNDEKKPVENKAKPDFGLSGKLAEEVNTYKGVVIKYSEPPEARKPKRRWRLYPFKGDDVLPTLYIHRQSAYLIGRDRKVVDLPVDHPSCSKQHAVLQYRVVPYTREDGTKGQRVRPYIIDLESANGTFVNNQKIDTKKYVELIERDVIKFAFSSREYVLLHEHSKDDELDDNVANDDDN